MPTVIVPAADERHPAELAVRCAEMIPNATLADITISNDLADGDAYAAALAPAILRFIASTL